MAKTEETKKTPKETKAKTKKTEETAKKPAAKKASEKKSVQKKPAEKKPAVKKPAAAKKPEKKQKNTTITASDAWKEKKTLIRERSKEPKTLAERRAREDIGPFRLFLRKYSFLWNFFLVPFFTFALLCLYTIATGNDRPAAVWCVEMSRHLFGAICFLFYVWVAVFCIRFWMKNVDRFKEMPYRRYF